MVAGASALPAAVARLGRSATKGKYDTRRNRNVLERPTQLEVGRLLLQGRSPSYSAAAPQVDGVDSELCAPERHPDHFAFDRISSCSIAHCESQGSREWHRVYHWSCFHYRLVPGVRLLVFTCGMKALPNQITADDAGWL